MPTYYDRSTTKGKRIEDAVFLATEVVRDPNAWVRVAVEEADGESRGDHHIGALGRIRTYAPASGGRRSIP